MRHAANTASRAQGGGHAANAAPNAQRSGLGSIARKLPRCGLDRMGSHQVRLGAVTAIACRADRTVNFCESFGLGVSHRGPWAADLLQAATYRIRAASPDP